MTNDDLHALACESGEPFYIDPETGYQTFTGLALEERGDCCGTGCRHCPYGHRNVPRGTPTRHRRDPWIEGAPGEGACDVLFWRGTEGDFQALGTLTQAGTRPVVLMVTFEDDRELAVPEAAPLSEIRTQAKAQNLPLFLVPLYSGADYVKRISSGLQALGWRRPVFTLVFGELGNLPSREWIQQNLEPSLQELGIGIRFPDSLEPTAV